MILSIAFWIISVGVALAIEFGTGIYQYWWTFLIAIVLLPVIYVLVFGAYIIVLFFWSLFLYKDKKKEINAPNKFYFWIIRQTCYLLVQLSNTKIYHSNLHLVPKDRKFLIVNNHTSNFDQICMMAVMKESPITYITKPQNENIPIAGPFIHKAGFIPIDRENDFNALKAIVKATNYVKKGISTVSVSPEGHRSKDGVLQEFKPGSFKIAYKSECPIVVISIKNANKIHSNFPFKRTKVYFDVVEVLYFDDYKDMTTPQLSSKIREDIRLKLQERDNIV